MTLTDEHGAGRPADTPPPPPKETTMPTTRHRTAPPTTTRTTSQATTARTSTAPVSGPQISGAVVPLRELALHELVCPGCAGPVSDRPPAGWPDTAGGRPRFSHPDGSVLCPGDQGRLAEPVEAAALRYRLTDAGAHALHTTTARTGTDHNEEGDR